MEIDTMVKETEGRLIERERQRMSAARMFLLERQSFWGHLLLGLRLIPVTDLPAPAATDLVRHLWFNPHFTRQFTFAQLGFLLAHEVGHIVFQSGHRRQGRNPTLWNMATDYAINRIVANVPLDSGSRRMFFQIPTWTHPDGAICRILLDDRFRNLPAEAIYQDLQMERPPKTHQIRIRLPRELVSEGSSSSWTNEVEIGDLLVEGIIDHRGGLDIHLPEAVFQDHQEEIGKNLRQALEFWKNTGQRGALPGSLSGNGFRNLQESSSHRSNDWRSLLREFAREAFVEGEEYSRARPHRRYLDFDLIVPSVCGERLSGLVVALDSSGSMSPGTIAGALREISRLGEIAESCLVLVGDAAVQQVIPTELIESFVHERMVKGGGGTDHRPIFAWLEKYNIVPTLFICISDLHSRFPDQAPSFPVLWLSPPYHGPSPWGAVIEMNLAA